MPARFIGAASVSQLLLLVCLVVILQNIVVIFHQLYYIHDTSRALRTKHLAWLATDKLREKSLKHFNPFIKKRMSMENEGENKWEEKNLIREFKLKTAIRQSTPAGQTDYEKTIDRLAKNWKDHTKKQKVFTSKNPAVGSPHIRTNFTPVLVLGYSRSGSSWIANMIRQSDRTFYVLEPFKLYQEQSYYTEGFICYNNNTCRKSDISSDKHGFALFALQQLFNCRFERLAPKIVSQVTQEFHRSVSPCTDAEWNSTKCINFMKRKCFESSHRVIKTIRISMSLVIKLAELVPRLKVIHLLLDPRAIIHSRKKGYVRLSSDVISQTKTLCRRIEEDIDISKKIKAKKRGKIATIIYEALVEYPDIGVQFLYNFLQLSLDEKTFSSMETTSIDSINNSNNKIYQKYSAEIAHRWRSKMPFNITWIIDDICGPVYSYVGYVAMKLESNLNDTEFLTRNINPLNDDSWFQ